MAEPSNTLDEQMTNLAVSSPTSVTPPPVEPATEETQAALDAYKADSPDMPTVDLRTSEVIAGEKGSVMGVPYLSPITFDKQQRIGAVTGSEVTMDKLGPMGFVTKRKNFLDRSMQQDIVTVQEAFTNAGTSDKNFESLVMQSTGFKAKDVDADPLPDGSYPTKTILFFGPENYETRLAKLNAGKALTLDFKTSSGKSLSKDIPYSAITENYMMQPEEIDSFLKINLPWKNRPQDDGYFDIAAGTTGFDNKNQQAIFAKRFVEHWRGKGMSERNIAGVLKYRISLGRPLGALGSDIGAYGDVGLVASVPSMALRLAFDTGAFLLGEALEVFTFGMADMQGYSTGGYNLSTPEGREAAGDRILPRTETLLLEHYDSLNLDLTYAQTESMSRFFTSPVSTLVAVIGTEKAASKFAIFTKGLSGERERRLFNKYRREMEEKHPNSEPEDIIKGFEVMRKRQYDIPFTDMHLTFKSDKIYDTILKVPVVGRPLAEVVDKTLLPISVPGAWINGIRTSSAMKAGMQLEEAALDFRKRPRVRQFMDYRRDKIRERKTIRELAATEGRTLNAGEIARVDELTRQIDKSRDELRAVIARSEVPEFARGEGLDFAFILGSATANTVSTNYGGDPLFWEFLGGMSGMALYGLGHSGSAFSYVKDTIRGVREAGDFKALYNARKLGELLVNVPTEFREGMLARAKYFDTLKQSLVAEGIDSSLLDRSAAGIFKLTILQTLEEGMRINLDAPGTAQFKEAQVALQETLQQQTVLIAELRGVFERLSRLQGVNDETTAANKLFTTVQAALEHGKGKIDQLDADMAFINANFEEVTLRRIAGNSDALGIALTPDAEKNWDSTLQRLFDDGVTILSTQELVKKGRQIDRKHDNIMNAIVDKAVATATRVLPSADRAKKTAEIALPESLPVKDKSDTSLKPKEDVLPVFEKPEDIMALGFETARAVAREKASLPYKSLNGQIFTNPNTSMPVVGDTLTDGGIVFDGVMKALGKADNIELEQALNPSGASVNSMNKLVRSLGAAAEGSLERLAKDQGFESVEEAIESAQNAAREAGRFDEFFAGNIPPALSAVNYIRTVNKERGVDIEMMPLDFLQVKELREALNSLSFSATKRGNNKGAADYTNLSNLTNEAMSNFVVVGSDGTRTRAGDLIAKVKMPDGRIVEMPVNKALQVADEGWTDYKTRFDGNPIVSNWMGIGRFPDEPRVGVEPSADFPLGMRYGNVPTNSWFDVQAWASKSPSQSEADFKFVELAVGRRLEDGTFRIDVSTPNGRMFKESLGAIYRDWVLRTIEDGNTNFNDFNRISNSFESSFRAVDANGNPVQLIDTEGQFRKMYELSPEAIGEQAFTSAQNAKKKLAKEQGDEIKRQAKVIREGTTTAMNFLQNYTSEKLKVSQIADEIISGGPVRVDQLRRHLSTAGKMSKEDIDLLLRSVLMEAIEQKTFKPTGSFIANVNPDATRSSKNLAQKLTQEYNTDMAELSRLIGFGDSTLGPMVRDIVGEKAYKTYTDVLQFMSDQKTRKETGIKFTGIPREFSVESYISRFYAVNRGVVSFRYVGTEAVLQSMRQNNMSMMHQIISNPRVGELFLEMVRTGKPLPFDKEKEMFKLLVIGYERYMTTKQPVSIAYRTSEGHTFIFRDPSRQGTEGGFLGSARRRMQPEQ